MRAARWSRRGTVWIAGASVVGALLSWSALAWATQASAIFPSDRHTVADPTQLTGRRVSLAMPSCPTDPSGCDDVMLLNQLDGFSVNPRIAITFDGAIKIETVTRETAFLVVLGPEGPAAPIALGQLVWDSEGNVLYARPERALRQSRIYALVVTTRVLDAEGRRLRPAPEYLKPREGTGHDRKVETQMWKAIAPAGLKWADIAAISLFTTQSVTTDLERMRAVLESRAPPALTFDLAPGGAASVYPRAGIQSIEFRRQVATTGMLLGDVIPLALHLVPATEVRAIAFGRYRSPSFLSAERHIPQVPTRMPYPQPTVEEEIHVTLFIPEGGRPPAGWPVAIFGHGFTNDRNVIPPSVAGTLARNGFATIAINVVGHGAGPDGTLTITPVGAAPVVLPSGGRGLDLNDDKQIGLSEGVSARVGTPLQSLGSRDGLKQTVADLVQLVRAIRRGVDVDGDGQPDLDREKIYYFGQSFGGIYGTLLLAVEPRIRAGVLNVPGGPIIEIGRQAAAFRPSVITALQSRTPSLMNGEKDFVEAIPLPGEPSVKGPPAGALDIQEYFDRVEWLSQPANPVAFAPYLIQAPSGGQPRAVMYQWAVGDRTVPNPTTESLLRAGDLAKVASLYRHDKVAAGLPERFSANPHGFLTWTFFPDVADIARAAQEQVVRFFLTDGRKIEQVDPRFEIPPPASERPSSGDPMKITSVETLHADGGWRPWTFVKVQTDAGITGWGECSDNRSPFGIAGCVRDMADLLLGEDPRPVERLYWDMLRRTRQNLGGVTHKAIAGVELALWDIKAKALGVPVYELFGGPMRDRMRLYWSHCGTTRARLGHVLGTPPLRTYDDIAALGREVVAKGFTALKTNMVIPGDPATVYFPGFGSGINTTDGAPTVEILDAIERLIGTFRDAVGPKVGLCLDLNYNFRTEGVLRVAKLLERFDMQWVEYDNWDPQALLQIKQSTSTRLASCESLVTTRQYRPFFELHAVDVAIIDVPWNGFSQAVQIGRMAECYEINIAPHNYYSHLADLHSLHLCAVLPNVRIMEIDIDDVPWKAELVTRPPQIRDGHIWLTDAPGWGADINEDVLRAHPWPGKGADSSARMFYGMDADQMGRR